MDRVDIETLLDLGVGKEKYFISKKTFRQNKAKLAAIETDRQLIRLSSLALLIIFSS